MNAMTHPQSLARCCEQAAPAIRPGLLVRLFDRLLAWQDRARERAALASLDERTLKDIGLTRADAEREAARTSWRF